MYKLLMLFLRTMFYGSVMKCINVTATTFTFLGGQFQIGDGATPENFTTINQVQSVDFGSSKRATEDVTSADNTDSVQRFAGRLKDPGMVSISVLWNPNDPTHQLFQAADDGAAHNFKCINPGGNGTRSFAGIIETADDHKLEINKGTIQQVKIKLSGPVTHSLAGA
ncbi:MAG: hypothetical protein ACJ71W_22105 [Terriglobales bacterium]